MTSEHMALSSLQNPRVKHVVKLRKRSARDEARKVLVEGYREIKRALENGITMDELYICPDLFLGGNEPDLISVIEQSGARVFQCTEPVFSKMAYRDRPEGLLAICAMQEGSLQSLDVSDRALLVVAETIEKPGNLGTIIRSADAVGADAVIVCDGATDIYNPNTVRASIGTLFTLPVMETTSDEAIQWLKSKGVRIVAATPSADTLYTEVDLRGPAAIVVGAEQFGISEKWMEAADVAVRIPMLGQVDSLNVATATTILLYEIIRQRGS